MTEQNSTEDFESSLKKLEDIVDKMEQGQLSLSQSLEAFEQGVTLTRQCQDTLKNAEQRVSQLINTGDELREADFDSDAQD